MGVVLNKERERNLSLSLSLASFLRLYVSENRILLFPPSHPLRSRLRVRAEVFFIHPLQIITFYPQINTPTDF